METPTGPKAERHPIALYLLFFTEMWERFSYYGMRALLTLYLVSEVTKGGLGWTSAQAGQLYGIYTGLVYVTPLIGGILADRILGYRLAIFLGGATMALGHASLALESMFFFYLGLFLIIIGNGLFKPNISSMVGQLYPEGSRLKDSAYTIFYMGINLGAFIGTLICGYLGENIGWHYGFGAAGIGMTLGLVLFYFGQSMLGEIGKRPKSQSTVFEADPHLPLETEKQYELHQQGYRVKKPLTKVERERLYVVFTLSFFSILFWLAFEQAGSSMNIYALKYTDRFLGESIQIDAYQVKSEKSSPNDSVLLLKVAEVLNEANNKKSTQELKNEIDALEVEVFVMEEKALRGNETLQEAEAEMARFAKAPLQNPVYYSKTETHRTELSQKPALEIARGRYVMRKFDSLKIKLADKISLQTTTQNKSSLSPRDLASVKEIYVPKKYEEAYKVLALNKSQPSFVVPASWFQSVNAFFIFTLAPFFSLLWVQLDRAKLNPNGPVKFAIGLLLLGLGFVALVIGSASIAKGAETASVSMLWLILAYLLHTMGELCLSPVGLSFVNKLSPTHLLGMMFGVWFLASAIGNYIGGALSGLVDSLAEKASLSDFFLIFVFISVGASLLLFLLSPLLKKWMHNVR
ncbi:MAG: hypothetical protein OHK0053_06930 [Microscillaceae bacterium]